MFSISKYIYISAHRFDFSAFYFRFLQNEISPFRGLRSDLFFRLIPLLVINFPLTKTFPPSISPVSFVREEEKARANKVSRRTESDSSGDFFVFWSILNIKKRNFFCLNRSMTDPGQFFTYKSSDVIMNQREALYCFA